jgi:Tol biopolymer transport system component
LKLTDRFGAAPHGAALFCSYLDSFNPSNNLWLQPLDGSAPRQLTHFSDGKTIGHYAWSRDGKRLAMSRATQSSDIVLFRGLKEGR